MINNGDLTSEPIIIPIIFPDYFGIADFDDDGRMDPAAADRGRLHAARHPPDWNTSDLDSRGLDVGRMPVN